MLCQKIDDYALPSIPIFDDYGSALSFLSDADGPLVTARSQAASCPPTSDGDVVFLHTQAEEQGDREWQAAGLLGLSRFEGNQHSVRRVELAQVFQAVLTTSVFAGPMVAAMAVLWHSPGMAKPVMEWLMNLAVAISRLIIVMSGTCITTPERLMIALVGRVRRLVYGIPLAR